MRFSNLLIVAIVAVCFSVSVEAGGTSQATPKASGDVDELLQSQTEPEDMLSSRRVNIYDKIARQIYERAGGRGMGEIMWRVYEYEGEWVPRIKAGKLTRREFEELANHGANHSPAFLAAIMGLPAVVENGIGVTLALDLTWNYMVAMTTGMPTADDATD